MRDRYPAITNHRAPHKPFLLLSVMDLIAECSIGRTCSEVGTDLRLDWCAVSGVSYAPSAEEPGAGG